MKQKRRGFTLVELLTVLAIISILVGMLFLGARHVSAAARTRKTLVTLKSLQGMLAEFESRGGKMDQVYTLYVAPNKTVDPGQETMPQGVFIEDFAYNAAATDFNPALKDQLLRTQRVMLALASVPENKVILDKLMEHPENYLKAPSSTQACPGPILMDAWGSPILFAPGRMSNGVIWGAAGMYVTNDPNSPLATKNTPAGWKAFMQPPDGKGMFMSAGEDGNFSQGDDNLYSYEK